MFLSRFDIADRKRLAGIHAFGKKDQCAMRVDDGRYSFLSEPV